MVSRFREEIRRQADDVEDALARTMATAGRTVAVSGITVAISLAGLLIFPQVFLRSMGFGGMSAVLIAMLAALTLLPALLAMLGPKVDALSVRPWLRRVFRRAGRARPTERPRRLVPHRAQRHAPAGRSTRSPSSPCWSRWRCRSCACSSAGSTSGRCRPAPRAGWSPRRSAPTSPSDPSGPIEAIVTLPDAGRLPRRRRGAAVLRRRRGRRPRGRRRHRDRRSRRDGARVDRLRRRPDGRGGAGPGRRHPRRAGAGGREVLVGGQSAVLTDLLESLGALLPWMALMVVGDDVRAAVPGLRLGRAAGQGPGHERAVDRRLVRRAGLDLPGRQPVGVPELHARPGSSRRPSRSWCWRSSSGCRWTTRSSSCPGSASSTT